MRPLITSLLIFISGWGLGWYTHHQSAINPKPFAQSTAPAPSKSHNLKEPETAATTTTPTPNAISIYDLLQRNQFDLAVERYESLQAQADDETIEKARESILSHVRQLNTKKHFALAEQLLQRYLIAAHRDVEARILLAETYREQENLQIAIDQLYEARGYEYRPERLKRITTRIRSMVAELNQLLKRNNDLNALLALYQHLTQLEPDHASWFIDLAVAQLALEDKEAARRSLLLVSQDADVGARAQAMLSKLRPVVAELQIPDPQNTPEEVAGIPLQRKGNHFIVDAKPTRGRNVQLLIDTGASLTILTPEVFEQRGIRYRDTGKTKIFNTANGSVRAPIYILDALAVGDWQVSQLEVGILDLGNQSRIDGLLGMNFLQHFQFFIDQNEALLRLSAN